MSDTKLFALDTRVEIKLGDSVLHSSQNLRGIIEHQSRVGIEYVAVHKIKDGGLVYVSFKDQSWCRTQFTDFSIALGFIRTRWAKWGLTREVRNSDSYFSFI
jgi:hypothetical protein